MVQNQDKIPLTKEGLKELKEELQELREEKRPQVVERMADSRNVGDMTEDTEYSQAKQELNFLDGRIDELEDVINRAILIGENYHQNQVAGLGCRVTVKVKGKEVVFHLVGEWEANPTIQKISHQSPLGQALLGKKIGDKVEVEAPAGKVVYMIVKID